MLIGHAAEIVEPPARTLRDTIAVALLATCYLLSFHPFSRPVVLDPATWDYMSLALADGRVPYRDVFLHKTPGAMLIGAVGCAVARGMGLAPILGVHAVFIALGALGPALTFLLCRRHGVTRLVAFAASAWLLGVDQWSLAAIEGARPKVATTALGLLGLLVATRRPLLGGIFSGAASLCWQPGLVFALGSVVEICRDRALPRDRAATIGWFGAGAALPIIALLTYLASHGALRAFFEQAFVFNLHYVDLHARTPLETVKRVWQLAKQWNAIELTLLPAAVVGFWVSRTSPPVGLTVATVAYAALLFVSVQAWPDTILLAPGIAVALGQGLSGLLGRGAARIAAAAIVAAAALANLAAPASGRFFPPIDWAEQHAFMLTLAEDLAPRDTVYVVSCPEFLIHTGRHSALPWPYMWFGVDRFAASHTEGGFEGVLQQLASADPKLMIVCRRWSGDLRRRFEEWARDRYRRRVVRFYPHTKRPMVVYTHLPAG
jgi:hypothetical protein